MKHKASVVIISLLFLSPFFVQGQDIQILQTREEIRQKIQEKNSGLQTQIQEKRTEIKERINSASEEQKVRLQILAQERALKIISQVFERFEAVIVKFEGIVVRIETRITKLDAENINTSKTKELLLQSKTKIEEVTVLLAATKLELEASIAKEISKEQIRASIELCKNSLEEIRASLTEVIQSLKLIGDISSDSIFIEE